MSTYGEKIKQLRKENNLTQAELGEKLFVTSQAVSKWENDLSEPDLNSVKKMCELFNVSMDEFMEIETKQETTTPAEETATEPKDEAATPNVVDAAPQRTIEGYCEKCHKALYAGEYEVVTSVKRYGRTTRNIQHVFCKECAQILEDEQKKKEQERKESEKAEEKHKQDKGFVVGGLVGALIIAICVAVYFSQKNAAWLWGGAIVSYCAFAFVVQAYRKESAIFMMLGFFMRSFKMPAVIFSLELDGLFFLIFVKLLFGFLSGLLSVCWFLLGLAIVFTISGFAFPFEMVKYAHKYKIEQE